MSLETNQLELQPGERIYISPFTPMSEKLQRSLVQSSDVDFAGFIDRHKKGNNIISPILM